MYTYIRIHIHTYIHTDVLVDDTHILYIYYILYSICIIFYMYYILYVLYPIHIL